MRLTIQINAKRDYEIKNNLGYWKERRKNIPDIHIILKH